MIPAAIVIIGVILSGFSISSQEDTVKDLLIQRTSILQDTYDGKMEKEKAMKSLRDIETYPLLSKDIQGLETTDACQMDVVQDMEIKTVAKTMKMFNFASFKVDIDWSMRGLSGDYNTDGQYFVVVKSEGNKNRLSEFNLQ